MRLICPNCDAQYDVPDDVMPPEGRDVQCSNCGQTWFEKHPASVSDPEASENASAHEDEEVARPVDGEDAEASGPDPDPGHEPETEPDEDADPELDEFVPPAAPRRRALDPDVAAVLQAEAELETQARKNEAAGSVETQPDLGLSDTEGSDEARKRAREAQDRMARMRGESSETPAEETAVTTAAAGRPAHLPDIEEINSTLRSNSDRSPSDDPGQTAQVEARERKQFGRGFIMVVALAVILLLLYVFAPQLAEAVPQADPWISAYVGMVDQWRMWLDSRVEGLLSWLDAAAA